MKKPNIVLSVLAVKACMYVMEGPKSIEYLQLNACLSIPFKVNLQNTKRSLLMARFEKVLSMSCN